MASLVRWPALAVGAVAAAGAAVGAVWAVKDIPMAMGARPEGDRAERVRRSPQFRDGKFRNTVPPTVATVSGRDIYREWRRRDASRKPAQPIPVITGIPTPARSGLHVSWLGHATTLIEIEGRRVLLDPVWSDRCSPSPLVGPKRLHRLPYPLDALPEVDAIVISHDHYDHLDMPTVRALTRDQSAPFLVPLGVGAHLQRWGVPESRIIELDWDESATVSGVRFTITAARHFSGRGFSRDGTLWGSWVIAGPTPTQGRQRKVFYTGDTGYFDGFARIGAEHGPFDATLVQVGAYGEGWPDIHMTPEDGVRAHRDVRGGLMIPVHWCTYVLAFHGWAEPVERVWREAKELDVRLAVPRPGQRIDVDNPPEVDGWWQAAAASV
jgi:L-ascorbate metabolism protein UlaG (beta-lactamase superfamily)